MPFFFFSFLGTPENCDQLLHREVFSLFSFPVLGWSRRCYFSRDDQRRFSLLLREKPRGPPSSLFFPFPETRDLTSRIGCDSLPYSQFFPFFSGEVAFLFLSFFLPGERARFSLRSSIRTGAGETLSAFPRSKSSLPFLSC